MHWLLIEFRAIKNPDRFRSGLFLNFFAFATR
nr:MAG TPA: hypothetical protein [Caudoviricetes sp.]